MEKRRRFLAIIFCVLIANGIYPGTVQAELLTTSNGVQIETTSATTVEVSYGTETMHFTVSQGSLSTNVVIDGQLSIDFNLAYNSYGEKVLASSTISFAGQSAWRDSSQMIVPGPCQPDGVCEDSVHPNLENQANLLTSALQTLHSQQFLASAASSSSEVVTGGWGCAFSIVGSVLALYSFITTCGTPAVVLVGPCLASLGSLVLAQGFVGSTCGGM